MAHRLGHTHFYRAKLSIYETEEQGEAVALDLPEERAPKVQFLLGTARKKLKEAERSVFMSWYVVWGPGTSFPFFNCSKIKNAFGQLQDVV